ncbi:MAG: heme ABC exporter ATP-binding protein CcmA [Chloroflexi bacterium]|nr:heme ABC exporter ATP-binding protein CcmA [Chloroflexota bacterium]
MSTRAGAISIQRLTKIFGTRSALRQVDLDVEPGNTLVVFGPNGAGKTTLIKILATIMNPSSGTITFDGLDLKSHPEEIRRRIGIVTHQTFLYQNLTARENLEFYGRIYEIPNRKERIEEVVGLVGMTSRLHDRVGTLSRGMQQRISIARALLHKPTIMLLDEPETGLDQEAIPLLWRTLPGEGSQRRTVVLTTHNLERGLELCDHLAILDKGRIVFRGTHEQFDLASLKDAYHNHTGVAA